MSPSEPADPRPLAASLRAAGVADVLADEASRAHYSSDAWLASGTARVQPGVVQATLQRAAGQHGLLASALVPAPPDTRIEGAPC